MGKTERKSPLESRWRSWDNIIIIKAVGWNKVDWIGGSYWLL
jgi:hypothetical protein